ncbi:MAG: hypothetical protein E7645_01040 [Ruminococcaceae bacterium]|nr:hypothetical protein [Oscillospiraceae bacterium]
MKYIKQIAACLLGLCLILSAFSCGQYNDPLYRPDATNENETIAEDQTEAGDDDSFSVTLTLNGEPFVPSEEEPLNAQWTDGFSFHAATFDENGKATISGLDGDYQVTLSSVPEGLAYNPNVHTADNINRHIEIPLYEIIKTRGDGSDEYHCISLNTPGVYQVTLNGPRDKVFYEFRPLENGQYSVESWMDVTANSINPRLDVYTGTFAAKWFAYELDDGGAASQYTKNFCHNVKISDEEIGNVFTFAVKSDTRDNKYPVTVTFVVQFNGGFSWDRTKATLILPTENFKHAPDYDKNLYDFVGAEISMGSFSLFDGDRFALNEEDGYYHLIDEATGKPTGPILFAKISQPCRFFDDAFTAIEYRGNKALTVSNNTENYKLFIEGWSAMMSMGQSMDMGYFCAVNCPCWTKGECPGACVEGCENCTEQCTPCPPEAIGASGYAGYCNTDGCYPVTEELKEFLQKYSISQLLFRDGQGFVETHESIKAFATEADQWLFACGYYVEK